MSWLSSADGRSSRRPCRVRVVISKVVLGCGMVRSGLGMQPGNCKPHTTRAHHPGQNPVQPCCHLETQKNRSKPVIAVQVHKAPPSCPCVRNPDTGRCKNVVTGSHGTLLGTLLAPYWGHLIGDLIDLVNDLGYYLTYDDLKSPGL